MQTVLKTERSGIREGTGQYFGRGTNAMQNNDNPLELFDGTNGLLPPFRIYKVPGSIDAS